MLTGASMAWASQLMGTLSAIMPKQNDPTGAEQLLRDHHGSYLPQRYRNDPRDRHWPAQRWQRRKEVGKALHQASQTVGFIYVTNHGIPDDLIKRAHETALAFFRQPRK